MRMSGDEQVQSTKTMRMSGDGLPISETARLNDEESVNIIASTVK